jgi:hypothetical protein
MKFEEIKKLKLDMFETTRLEETVITSVMEVEESEFDNKITPAHYRIMVYGKVYKKIKPIEIKIVENASFVDMEELEAMLYQKVQINDILLSKVNSNTYYRVSKNNIKLL